MLLTALLGLALGANAETAPETSPTISIPFEEYDLDNGLHVILSEDHSVPFVQVNLWYRVGAKDEVEGPSNGTGQLSTQGLDHGISRLCVGQLTQIVSSAGCAWVG